GLPGIGQALRAVFRHRVTVQCAAAGAQFGGPADHGNADHRLGSGVFAVGNEIIRGRAGRGGAVIHAFKKPVGVDVVRVELPVIPRDVISAGTVQGEIQIGQLIGGGKSGAVNQRADRMTVGQDIHRDGNRRVGAIGDGAGDQGNIVHVK